MLVTRIAPTPSGYLHPGNAVNFVLTAWLAAQHQGKLLLRIDDMDAGRVRRPYLEDVFRVLDWLGLAIDGGPSDVASFEREFSMRRRTEYYREELLRLPGLFACRCSRRDLAGHAAGFYPGTCRAAGLTWHPGVTAVRIEVPRPCPIQVEDHMVDVAGAMGDFVVWRRDDAPAYQLASVIEDRDLGVNAVVRGLDLLDSTAAQLFLAPQLAATQFAAADFRHHELIRDEHGTKLSKSLGRTAQSMVGDPELLRRILDQARRLAPGIGVAPV